MAPVGVAAGGVGGDEGCDFPFSPKAAPMPPAAATPSKIPMVFPEIPACAADALEAAAALAAFVWEMLADACVPLAEAVT